MTEDEEVIEHLKVKLMTAEEELKLATAAIKALRFINNDADAFFAKACTEISNDIKEGNVLPETGAMSIRWMSRLRHAMGDASSKIFSSHGERRGEVETLRWMLASLKVSNQE